MKFRPADVPFFLTTILRSRPANDKGFYADFANRIEKILKDPRQPWTGEFNRRFCIDFEDLHLELSGR